MEEIDPRHLLVKIAEILERLRIPYLVTGGMAVLVWGRPRFTADIDIIIGLQPEKVDDLEKALSCIGEAVYIDKDSMIRALKNFGEFNYIDSQTGLKVDFWVLKNNPFERLCLKRVIKKKILSKMISFISPEDLILSKLIWYKKTYSSRHLEDIQSILKISRDEIDQKYLRDWARRLEVAEILKDLMDKIPMEEL